MTDKEILGKLKTATRGVLVMSESDYPFELIQWDGQVPITAEYLCEVSGSAQNTTILETDVDSFLGENEQFHNLLEVLKNNLADIKVYKVGVINIPVYVVGRSAEGNWLGVSTRLIQT